MLLYGTKLASMLTEAGMIFLDAVNAERAAILGRYTFKEPLGIEHSAVQRGSRPRDVTRPPPRYAHVIRYVSPNYLKSGQDRLYPVLPGSEVYKFLDSGVQKRGDAWSCRHPR